MPDHETDSAQILATVLRRLLDDWPGSRARIHLPEPRGLGGSQEWFHFHVFPEIFLQLGGHTEFCFPEGGLTLQAGEALILPRLLPHREYDHDEPDTFANLVVMPNGRHLGMHIASHERHRARVLKRSQWRFANESVRTLIACCDEANRLLHEHPEQARPEAADGLIHAALLSLESTVREELQAEHRPQGRIERCCDLIEMNLTSHSLSVAELARWLDCHPDYLSTSFRRERGSTIVDHIAERRIDMAQRLLRETGLRVAEIAWACGFADPAYFSRRFRQKCSLAPQRYRQQQRRAG